MGGSGRAGAVRLPEVSVPRFFKRRRPLHVAEAVAPQPTPAVASVEREETVLLVEMEGWAELLAADPVSARRVRARMRRMVAGATARYAGEVEREEGGVVASRFPWARGAALAAEQARAALTGAAGVSLRMVVHAAGGATRVAGAAALRDITPSGGILLIDDVATQIATSGDDGRASPLGTYMLAGVPRPVRAALLEPSAATTAREAAVWGAPWAVRLARRGLLPAAAAAPVTEAER